MRDVCGQLLDRGDDLGPERVAAAAVRLLDYGLFRIGGTPRSAESESFGLTTVRKDHVTVDGRWVDVDAAAVNAFVKEHGGDDFSAKDFRTWDATVLAAVAVAVSGWVHSATGRKRAVTRAVAEVAHYLGNTPAVARASYIDPWVFDRYRPGWTTGGVLEGLADGAADGQPAIQGLIEEAVVDLLTDYRSSDAVVRGPVLEAA